MELGNLVFGHSRGEYPVPRTDFYYDQLFRLFEAIQPDYDSSDGLEYENATFETHMYYWGTCVCGYDERKAKWSERNKHRENCYQTALDLLRGAWLNAHPEPEGTALSMRVEQIDIDSAMISLDPVGASDKWREWYSEKEKFMDSLYDTLCAEFKLDRKYGCAAHCTCDYDERWAKFLETNDHKPNCPIVRPNFLHKPSGLVIMWYKYFLRDAYSNKKLSRRMFKKVIDDCIASVTEEEPPEDDFPF